MLRRASRSLFCFHLNILARRNSLRLNFDSLPAFSALHSSRGAAARAAAGPGRVLHPEDAALLRPRRRPGRPRLHVLLHRPLRRVRPLRSKERENSTLPTRETLKPINSIHHRCQKKTPPPVQEEGTRRTSTLLLLRKEDGRSRGREMSVFGQCLDSYTTDLATK